MSERKPGEGKDMSMKTDRKIADMEELRTLLDGFLKKHQRER